MLYSRLPCYKNGLEMLEGFLLCRALHQRQSTFQLSPSTRRDAPCGAPRSGIQGDLAFGAIPAISARRCTGQGHALILLPGSVVREVSKC